MQRRDFLKSVGFMTAIPFLPGFADSFLLGMDDDAVICSKKFEFAASLGLQNKPINDVIIEMGKSFLGTEYVAHTLEQKGEEHLVVNMRGLDCVSFCENSIVFARCIKKGTTTFEDYKKELQFIRYRGGIIDGYPSRLHYFSDYIFDNEKKGVLKNVTKAIGGVPFRKTINFMSTHLDSYPALLDRPDFVKRIKAQEAEISKRSLHYIPKESVGRFADGIMSGDILAITTTLEGMDIAHTGVAIRQKEKLHFMHAPISGSKVMITEKTLSEYLAGNRKQTGIMVARPLEPQQ